MFMGLGIQCVRKLQRSGMSGIPKAHAAPTELNGFGAASYRHVAPTALALSFLPKVNTF